jgi:hypothetical protein
MTSGALADKARLTETSIPEARRRREMETSTYVEGSVLEDQFSEQRPKVSRISKRSFEELQASPPPTPAWLTN